jgi:hypothetical protein
MVDVAEYAEAELRVLVQHAALGRVILEVGRRERVVPQHLAEQIADLAASYRSGVFSEQVMAGGCEPLKIVPHKAAPVRRSNRAKFNRAGMDSTASDRAARRSAGPAA